MTAKITKIVYVGDDGKEFDRADLALLHDSKADIIAALRLVAEDYAGSAVFSEDMCKLIADNALQVLSILQAFIGSRVEGVEAPYGRDIIGTPLPAPMPFRHPDETDPIVAAAADYAMQRRADAAAQAAFASDKKLAAHAGAARAGVSSFLHKLAAMKAAADVSSDTCSVCGAGPDDPCKGPLGVGEPDANLKTRADEQARRAGPFDGPHGLAAKSDAVKALMSALTGGLLTAGLSGRRGEPVATRVWDVDDKGRVTLHHPGPGNAFGLPDEAFIACPNCKAVKLEVHSVTGELRCMTCQTIIDDGLEG